MSPNDRRASPRPLSRVWLFASVLAPIACRTVATTPPRAMRAWPGAPGLYAGVSEVDITPPLGLGLYGHGFESRPAEGVRLRLRCQSFVFVKREPPPDDGGVPRAEKVALVTCDLAAPSLALQRLVVERVRAQGVDLGAERVLIMATHTHAGPAHYFRPNYYAGAFSSSVPGYDPRVERFLANAIADGIVQAAQNLHPATVQWSSRAVFGLTRNRSIAPFFANNEAAEYVAEMRRRRPLDAPTHGPARAPPEVEFAVDPTLTVLSIRCRTDAVSRCTPRASLGAFAVFAMHPTAIPNTNDMYHGDVFGYATRLAERLLSCDDPAGCTRTPEAHPVVGIANGTEGDVSPSWQSQNPTEARRLGESLAREIQAAVDRSEAPDGAQVPLVVRYRDLHFRSAQLTSNAQGERLCAHAELGAPAAGGAEDGPTRFRVFPEFNEGMHAGSQLPLDPCHGRRIPIIELNEPDDDALNFPELAPISVVRLGTRVLGTIPGEPTTMAGREILQQMRPHAPVLNGNVVLVGLTNEYLQYVTTRAEYDLQHYEGASTLWGPQTSRFLGHQLACLMQNLDADAPVDCGNGQSEAIDRPSTATVPPSHVVSIMPDGMADPDEPFNPRDPPIQYVRRAGDGRLGARVRWQGAAPAWVTLHDRLRVTVRDIDSDVIVDTDDGTDIEVRVVSDLGAPEHAALWEARWLPSDALAGPLARRCSNHRLRFEIHSVNEVRSQPIVFNRLVPRETVERTTYEAIQ